MRYIGDGQPVGFDIIAEKIPEWIALYEKKWLYRNSRGMPEFRTILF